MFKITKNEASNKTIRMPDHLIARLEKIAQSNDISFNKVVIQCCEYALQNIERDTEK